MSSGAAAVRRVREPDALPTATETEQRVPRIGYLTGRYPAVSHSFILREVEALRALGVEVETISIHTARSVDRLSADHERAYATTYAVLPPDVAHLAKAHASALLSRPRRYLATLRLALRFARPGLRGRVWGVFYFAEALLVWRVCRERGIRHLHAQFANQASDVAMLVAELADDRRRGGRRFTWSLGIHGSAEFYDVTLNRLAAKLRRATFATAVSDFCRSQLLGLVEEEHWPKVHVVHCGVDVSRFSAPEPKDPQPGEPVRILTVGRLVEAKGYAILLEALAEVLRRGVEVEVTFVGDGPRRASLERVAGQLEIAHHVRFAGALGQDDILDRYAAADVFCLSSFAEGVPVVLMEAMAMRRPVIATRIMGVPELVDDGVNGLLVPPARADRLADAIEALATSAGLRREMGRAGREKVCAEFDVARSAAVLRRIFAERAAA